EHDRGPYREHVRELERAIGEEILMVGKNVVAGVYALPDEEREQREERHRRERDTVPALAKGATPPRIEEHTDPDRTRGEDAGLFHPNGRDTCERREHEASARESEEREGRQRGERHL